MSRDERRWIERYKVVVRRVEKRDSCETKTSDLVIGSSAELDRPNDNLRALVRSEGNSTSFASYNFWMRTEFCIDDWEELYTIKGGMRERYC